MSHSLRAKIKCLRYKGIITDKDCDRLRKALDNEDVLEDIKAEIQALDTSYCGGYIGLSKQEVLEIIDKHMKGDSE